MVRSRKLYVLCDPGVCLTERSRAVGYVRFLVFSLRPGRSRSQRLVVVDLKEWPVASV